MARKRTEQGKGKKRGGVPAMSRRDGPRRGRKSKRGKREKKGRRGSLTAIRRRRYERERRKKQREERKRREPIPCDVPVEPFTLQGRKGGGKNSRKKREGEESPTPELAHHRFVAGQHLV